MPRDLLKAFGARVRKLRKAKGWSLEELAYRAKETNVGYLNDVELGKVEPCLKKIKALSKALRVPLFRMMRDL